ncbi:MAG: HTH domain-containing protein [Gemmataceae bacterium]
MAYTRPATGELSCSQPQPVAVLRKSLEIEQRLAETLRLIQTGRYSTPLLAAALGVSVPTVSRYVTALRERGHDIRAERHPEGWRYIAAPRTANQQSTRTAGSRNKKRTGT